eukprot:19758-Heterococcus_DN1.PRE.1
MLRCASTSEFDRARKGMLSARGAAGGLRATPTPRRSCRQCGCCWSLASNAAHCLKTGSAKRYSWYCSVRTLQRHDSNSHRYC